MTKDEQVEYEALLGSLFAGITDSLTFTEFVAIANEIRAWANPFPPAEVAQVITTLDDLTQGESK